MNVSSALMVGGVAGGSTMKMNLDGRVRNLTLAKEGVLIPLYEAISNSIHAIEERTPRKGRIVIQIERDKSQKLLGDEFKGTHPISGFTIEDDGVGFTEANFASFREADSPHKRAKGGKGVGRLYWLKAFEQARVESVFRDDDATWRRAFDFKVDGGGIVNHEKAEATADERVGTRVRLIGLKEEYRRRCPKSFEVIERRIIEHFLRFFILHKEPVILLRDGEDDSDVCLNGVFERKVKLEKQKEGFKVAGHEFVLENLRILSGSRDHAHALHFCAHERAVEDRKLVGRIPNLAESLKDEDGRQFVYAGYVSGKILDENVNQERTRFQITDDSPLEEAAGEVTWKRLIEAASERAKAFLEPYLEPVRQRKLDRIREFVQKEPKYRSLLKLRPEWIDHRVQADLSYEDLDMALYGLLKQLEVEIRAEGAKVQREQVDRSSRSLEEHRKRFDKFLAESNSLGASKLAEYVVHRRATLDFLAECMKLDGDGKYEREKIIHRVIFPLGATSDDVPESDQMNLWIIDERLAYHAYLASDVPFKKIDRLKVDPDRERERMDMVALQSFDNPHAFVDSTNQPFNSVTIVEFKRPMRDDYKGSDKDRDPIDQVLGYVSAIREGEILDKDGQLIGVAPSTPFYVYIICSLTQKMKRLAERNNFKPTPDGLGYFQFHDNYNAYTEIISYTKLIQDSRKRNQAFFDRLLLPPYSPR